MFAQMGWFSKGSNDGVLHTELLGFWRFPLSGVLGSKNTTFRKLDLFLFSGEGGEDTYSVGPLRKSE
jgi:hypothetical protein